MAIDPSFLTTSPEWKLDGVGQIEPFTSTPEDSTLSSSAKSVSFGDMLGNQIKELQALQDDASAKAQDLVTGKADDPASVAMAAEKAKLSMQLATQIRERTVTALQEVLRLQV